MNLLMLTNTYLPHVGGVARSVEAFAREYRKLGHRVLIVAPVLGKTPKEESDVLRVPAIQNFNGSDFSVRLPIPGLVAAALRDFKPDVVHAHHPFLLGDTALRIAAAWDAPLVFTHHTMYERYTHYVPGDSPAMQRFAIDLSTGFANLCDQVFAPSESVAAVLRRRGVETPIEVVPTGVDVPHFADGDGSRVRTATGIPTDAYVVGHVGRLAPEKNLPFLAKAVADFIRTRPNSHFLVAGTGPSEEDIRRTFAERKLTDRLHILGICKAQELVDTYHAMDVFAFASSSETQGMVLTEAMAAGVPVVAVDAPGAREVVQDRRNGRLLASGRRGDFSAALEWMASRDDPKREALKAAACDTADEFSMPRCARRALAVYERLAGAGSRASRQSEQDGLWESSLRLLEAEWRLWTARAHAAGAAVQGPRLWKIPVFGRLLVGARWLRRALSRNEWAVWLFGLSRSKNTATEPGLILIQIDGLSRSQFDRAMNRRRLPFLRRLMTKEGYRAHTLYSGVPSTTPAVQGELFYGQKVAVPSFSFRDHETGQPVRMFDSEPAAKVQRRLAADADALVEGGSAYSDIYSGGATESHFCPATLGWDDVFRVANPLAWITFLAWHAWSVVRIAALMAVETVLAIVDCVGGLFAGMHLVNEIKFVPSRVGICILLREWITIGACIDAARGLPVIHVNFLGYDEQSHRRGPGSTFAHWSLRGIDDAIHRIWNAAHRSTRRDYQVWVYSDHGQEHTVPYFDMTGRTIHEAVAEVFECRPSVDGEQASGGVRGERGRWLRGRRSQDKASRPQNAEARSDDGERSAVLVTAMGPLGQVYPPEPLDAAARADVARRLVDEARIPLVLAADESRTAHAWNAAGEFQLPRDAAEVIGPDHPFLEVAADDLVAACHHPDAGPLVISGWTPNGRPVSFPQENGAHAGPGSEETRAFALLPLHVHFDGGRVLRPLELREAALEAMGRVVAAVASRRKHAARRDTVRILTYNVHSCVGLDGKLSPARIARVIAQCDPDIVTLQELDVGRERTGEIDQAHAIARELKMDFHFHAALQVEEEQYGDAVLSRYPMRLIRAAALPQYNGSRLLEPRGALWVAVDVDGRELQLLNTHLGLLPQERMRQVDALLGDEWLGDPRFREPCVVCGDFNAMPRSKAYRRMHDRLRDAQMSINGHRPQRTCPSPYPVGRIDHVFVGEKVEVVGIEVPRSQLARTASDHLPLLVEVRLSGEDGSTPNE